MSLTYSISSQFCLIRLNMLGCLQFRHSKIMNGKYLSVLKPAGKFLILQDFFQTVRVTRSTPFLEKDARLPDISVSTQKDITLKELFEISMYTIRP